MQHKVLILLPTGSYAVAGNRVPKRKRFSKWFKADQPKDMSIIMDYYGYSRDKALQVLPLFNKEQIKSLERKMYTGGKKKRK